MRFFLLLCMLFSFNIIARAQDGATIMQEPARPSGMRGAATDLPDISVVGDLAGKLSNISGDADKDRLSLRSVEFAYQGYVYPRARANVIVAFHKHEGNIETELEEANITFMDIFGGLGAKAGKMLGGFGKVNTVHPHHLPFADQPDAHKNFMGGHGLMFEGASLNCLLPLPFYAMAEAGWGHAPDAHHHSDEEAAEEAEFSFANQVYLGRLIVSFPLGRDCELAPGVSYVKGNGAHYLEHTDETGLLGFDLTYKSFPSTFSRFIIQNELFLLNRKLPVGTLNRYGFYSYLGYKMNPHWSAGARYDQAQDALPYEDGTMPPATSAQSLIITRNLTETTYLRGQYKYYNEPRGVFEVFLQLSFGIGPHSHPLE